MMDIRLNDILVMKKPHPCGEKRWKVLRIGADFRLRCLGCGHEVMTPGGAGRVDVNMRQLMISAAVFLSALPMEAVTVQHGTILAAKPGQ